MTAAAERPGSPSPGPDPARTRAATPPQPAARVPATGSRPPAAPTSAAAPTAAGPPAMLPPWPLVWLAVLAVSAPATVAAATAQVAELGPAGSFGPDLAATTSFAVLRAATLVTVLPVVVFLAGLVAVAAPQLRAAAVERRLELAAADRPVLREMAAFLDRHGAHVELRANLARPHGLARVYACGWRRARLAVFGPLVVLWRRDRAAAEAVLLHEVAHVRTGDHLLLGLGSPFVLLVRAWAVLAVGVLAAAPLAAGPTLGLLGVPAVLTLMAPVRLLVLPVGALWAAELAADRYVAACGYGPALRRVLDGPRARRGPLRRALDLLSHPPRALRRAALRGGTGRAVAVAAAWPLLVLVQLGVILAVAVPAWLVVGTGGVPVVELAITGSGTFLRDAARIWVPAALLLLAWPVLAPLWTRWWSGRAPATATGPRWAAPLAAALVAAVLGAAVLLAG